MKTPAGRRVGGQKRASRPGGSVVGNGQRAPTHAGELNTVVIESMLEHLPNMVFLKDAEELRFIHFNRAGEQLLGYSRSQLLGKNDYDFFPREEADCSTAKDRQVLASGRLLDILEEPIQTRHRGIRILHTKKIPICDAEGTPLYLLSISEDITERKKVEKRLRHAKAESEQRVGAGTEELQNLTGVLQKNIAQHKEAEKALQDVSARLIHAQEEERRRIARELHDDFSQRLAIMGIELEQLARQLPTAAEPLKGLCDGLWQKVRQLSNDLHGLSYELHPAKLDHLGLVPAVRSLCREMADRHHLTIHCTEQDVPRSVPRPIGLCLYRIAQEALQNVVKHSLAREASVTIAASPTRITLTVRDNGAGFDAGLPAAKSGLGLISMRERVRGLGGGIVLTSRPAKGTCVDVWVPLSAEPPEGLCP